MNENKIPDTHGLRVGVKGGGCSGLSYSLGFDAENKPGDTIIEFKLPNEKEVRELVNLTLKNGVFSFDKKSIAEKIIKNCTGLSYYSIQKTLITAIKRSLFATSEIEKKLTGKIDTNIWKELVEDEKQSLNK